MINAPFAPTLPFERPDALGGYAPLDNIPAVVVLEAPSAGPQSMGAQTDDITAFTQSGQVFVPRGSDLRAGDRFTYQGRKYFLVGARNWDINHPMTGYDFGWMTFNIVVDPAQLIADVLALRGQQIVLIPRVGVEGPGGGKDYGPGTARDPQLFVMVVLSNLDSREDAQTDHGQSHKFNCRLVGAADAQIAVDDTWEDAAATYTVQAVDRSKPYNVEAFATAFVKGVDGG